MHLEAIFAATFNQNACAFRIDIGFRARHEADKIIVEHVAIIALARLGYILRRSDKRMVDNRFIARHNCDGFNPFIILQRVRRSWEFIIEDTCRWNVEGRCFDDEVRFAEWPYARIALASFQRVRAFAARGTSINPADEGLLLRGGELARAVELTNFRVSRPRRHTLGTDHILDGGGEAFNHIIIRHRPWPNATGLVAGDTIFHQDRRDGLAIANFGMRFFIICAAQVYNAALGRARWRGNRGAGLDRRQCIFQIMLARLCFLTTIAKTVINRPSISDLPSRWINHQYFGRAIYA